MKPYKKLVFKVVFVSLICVYEKISLRIYTQGFILKHLSVDFSLVHSLFLLTDLSTMSSTITKEKKNQYSKKFVDWRELLIIKSVQINNQTIQTSQTSKMYLT